MHHAPLHYTTKDCLRAADSWLRSCEDPLTRSPETPLHRGPQPCSGPPAGSVSAPAGHLAPVLTTPDLVPGLGVVTSVRHVYLRHTGPGPDPSRQAADQRRKGVNPFPELFRLSRKRIWPGIRVPNIHVAHRCNSTQAGYYVWRGENRRQVPGRGRHRPAGRAWTWLRAMQKRRVRRARQRIFTGAEP